jgi:hypothetical protein
MQDGSPIISTLNLNEINLTTVPDMTFRDLIMIIKKLENYSFLLIMSFTWIELNWN